MDKPEEQYPPQEQPITNSNRQGSELVHGFEADRWGGWYWEEPMHEEHFRRCSYCGSVHPEDLVAEPEWHASWADQKYGWPHKFYVDIPNREPDKLFCVGSTSGNNPQQHTYYGESAWVAHADLTEEQRTIVERDRMTLQHATYYMFGKRPKHFGKFYTKHLADPDLDPDVKDEIERKTGMQFTFEGHQVRWRRTEQSGGSNVFWRSA